MRHTITLLMAAIVLTACSGLSGGNDKPKPKYGRVLAAAGGSGAVVVSLGTKDGVRSGQALPITRDGKVVGEIIIHEARESQSVGTPYGQSTSGTIRVGDMAVLRQ